MENKGQKKSADKVFDKKETSEQKETKEQEEKSARLAERKGQRPAFPFNRKKL